MGMKFERRLDSEAVDFLFLSQNYGKLAILQSDRNVEFQAPYGKHFKTRIPTFGRAMAYEPSSCELHITSSSGDVYRINLEEGRFSEPLSTKSVPTGISGTTCISLLRVAQEQNAKIQKNMRFTKKNYKGEGNYI